MTTTEYEALLTKADKTYKEHKVLEKYELAQVVRCPACGNEHCGYCPLALTRPVDVHIDDGPIEGYDY